MNKFINKYLKRLSILYLSIAILLLIGAFYFIKNNPLPCPQDAKRCPDGSYVVRTDPHCAFGTCKAPSPTSIETANPDLIGTDWKTYTNTVMKFSLKIPPNWFTHKEGKMIYGYTTHLSYPVDNPSPQNSISGERAQIDIGLSYNEPQNLDEEVKQRLSSPPQELKKDKEIQVGTERAVVLKSKDNNFEQVIIHHDNLSYDISLAINVNSNASLEEFLPTFDQILSTFRFSR